MRLRTPSRKRYSLSEQDIVNALNGTRLETKMIRAEELERKAALGIEGYSDRVDRRLAIRYAGMLFNWLRENGRLG